MLEPRFNSDSMAMLLNIPPQKTLLRRHLTTNFNNLVGAQAQQEKREYTEATGYSPLSITAKVKVRKYKKRLNYKAQSVAQAVGKIRHHKRPVNTFPLPASVRKAP